MPTRSDFIRTIGLTDDPFATPFAEYELKRLKDVFYSFYTAPLTNDLDRERFIQHLRAPKHAFVFGEPGAGKTTLRLTLDADCRTVLDQTLPISYILGEDIENPLSLEEHGQRLSKAFAIDFTLNVIERFTPLNPFPSETQIQELKRQVDMASRELNRLFDVILEQPDDQLDSTWGLSKAWSRIGIAPVKYVGSSKLLKELLVQIKSSLQMDITPGWDAFQEGLTTARQWGFSQFLILVDGVDTRQRSPEAMMALILPLLRKLRGIERKNVYFKFFLPKELENDIRQYLQKNDNDLLSNAFFSIISWNEASLRNLLQQRFRAVTSRSGPRYMGLDSLAIPGLNLDEKVIAAAQGSPRRLLQIVDILIDEHVKRQSISAKLDKEDWESCEHRLSTNSLF